MPQMCWMPCDVQFMHFWANWPHTVVLVPAWQTPLLSQQPSLHVA
jgi:hypothetical protein